MKKDNIATFLLCIYCLLLPFEEAFASSIGSINRIVSIVLIIYVLIVYNKHFRIDKTYIPLVVWFFYMLISIIWSSSFDWWLYFIQKYLFLIAFVLFVDFIPVKKINIKLVKWSMIFAGIIASLLLFFLPTASSYSDEGRRTIILLGSTIDPNILASIILLGVHLSLEFFFNKQCRLLLTILIFGVQLLGVLYTGSRGALIAFVIGTLIEFLYRFGGERKQRGKNFRILILGATLLAGIVLILPENLTEARFSKETLLGLNELSLGSHNRYTIWQHGLELFVKKPIFGYGCGNFFSAIETVYIQCASHNLYVLLLVEGGIIGFIIFTAFIVRLLKEQISIKNFTMIGLLFTVLAMGLSLDSLIYKYFWVAVIYARFIFKDYNLLVKSEKTNV